MPTFRAIRCTCLLSAILSAAMLAPVASARGRGGGPHVMVGQKVIGVAPDRARTLPLPGTLGFVPGFPSASPIVPPLSHVLVPPIVVAQPATVVQVWQLNGQTWTRQPTQPVAQVWRLDEAGHWHADNGAAPTP